MADLTSNPNDPRLTHGVDSVPVPQADAYLILSDEERQNTSVRPVRRSYVHVGAPGPTGALRPLTSEEHDRYYDAYGYSTYEDYREERGGFRGRYWTPKQLEEVGKGCGARTTMSLEIAETYARDPKFYGATYCVGCSRHIQVDHFVWDGTSERVGS